MTDEELKRLESLAAECEISKHSTVFPEVDDPLERELNVVIPAALAEIRRLRARLDSAKAFELRCEVTQAELRADERPEFAAMTAVVSLRDRVLADVAREMTIEQFETRDPHGAPVVNYRASLVVLPPEVK